MTQSIKIGEISSQIRGVSYSKSDVILKKAVGYLPVLRANNIQENGLLLSDFVYVPDNKISIKQKIKAGDVLIAASSGSIDVVGKAASTKEDIDAGFGAFCKILRPNLEVVDASYFAHFFQTKKYRRTISNLAMGANINNLKNEHLDNLEILLPSLAEQRRIASILDKADELRQKRQQSIEKLDQLLQATFIDMFGDPVSNPKQFSLVKLEDLVEKPITYGVLKPEEYNENGIPMLRIQDINTKAELHQLSNFHLISQQLSNQYKRTILNGEEIVISLVGTIGLVAKIPKSFKGFNVHRNLGIIDLNDKKIVDYLLYFMKMPEFSTLLDRICKGGVHKLLNLTDLRALKIPIPPKELQEKWSRIALNIENQKQKLHEQLDIQTQLFASLQNQAFNGKL